VTHHFGPTQERCETAPTKELAHCGAWCDDRSECTDPFGKEELLVRRPKPAPRRHREENSHAWGIYCTEHIWRQSTAGFQQALHGC